MVYSLIISDTSEYLVEYLEQGFPNISIPRPT